MYKWLKKMWTNKLPSIRNQLFISFFKTCLFSRASASFVEILVKIDKVFDMLSKEGYDLAIGAPRIQFLALTRTIKIGF